MENIVCCQTFKFWNKNEQKLIIIHIFYTYFIVLAYKMVFSSCFQQNLLMLIKQSFKIPKSKIALIGITMATASNYVIIVTMKIN